MTKKDYELIATAVRESVHYQTMGATEMQTKIIALTVTDTANRLANKLAVENDKFDRVRFLTACGVK